MSRLYDLNIDDSEGLTNQRGGEGFSESFNETSKQKNSKPS